jgi:methylmalonyl-CoA mutase cobalamin-binding subunit
MGFNRIYPPGTPIEAILPTLKADLGEWAWNYTC